MHMFFTTQVFFLSQYIFWVHHITLHFFPRTIGQQDIEVFYFFPLLFLQPYNNDNILIENRINNALGFTNAFTGRSVKDGSFSDQV